jgi:hypothetical protein
MPIQRRKSDLIKVNQSDSAHSRSSESGGGMGTHPAASNDDYKRRSKFSQPSIGEECAVSGELFKD